MQYSKSENICWIQKIIGFLTYITFKFTWRKSVIQLDIKVDTNTHPSIGFEVNLF